MDLYGFNHFGRRQYLAEAYNLMISEPNHSIQQTETSLSAKNHIQPQWRLASAADTGRSVICIKSIRCILWVALLSTFLACRTASTPISYSGGDGSSTDQAIMLSCTIEDKRAEGAERAWIAHKFPAATIVWRSPVVDPMTGAAYSEVRVTIGNGQSRIFYFGAKDSFTYKAPGQIRAGDK